MLNPSYEKALNFRTLNENKLVNDLLNANEAFFETVWGGDYTSVFATAMDELEPVALANAKTYLQVDNVGATSVKQAKTLIKDTELEDLINPLLKDKAGIVAELSKQKYSEYYTANVAKQEFAYAVRRSGLETLDYLDKRKRKQWGRRVTSATACQFCRTLDTQGRALYFSRDSARRTTHANCSCEIFRVHQPA